jgi:quinol-cytochrome oxidoreductase complex cytochrome b subunit
MELQLLVSPCHLYILYILSRGEQEEQEEEVQRLLLSSGCSIRSIERLFLSKVGRDSGPQSYQHVPILKVIAVIALLHLLIMSWIGYLESPTLERGAPWMGKWQNGNGVIVPPFCQMIHLIVFSRRSSCLVPPRAG